MEPGNYAIVCLISGADHVQHYAKGMVRALTVVPSSEVVPAPTADVRLVLPDYAFAFSPDLTRGRHVLRVENSARQPHHVALLRLHDGTTMAEAMQWNRVREGPPPFDIAGGITPISPGRVGYLTMDFPPGNYVLVCFVPDATDGKPHVAHGMRREMKVE